MDHLGPHKKKKCENVTYVVVGIKIGEKGCVEFISEVFWKIFKNEDFGFDIFEKGQILRPFQQNIMVAYVHIEYSTYKFSFIRVLVLKKSSKFDLFQILSPKTSVCAKLSISPN